jgi:hypothetical protein
MRAYARVFQVYVPQPQYTSLLRDQRGRLPQHRKPRWGSAWSAIWFFFLSNKPGQFVPCGFFEFLRCCNIVTLRPNLVQNAHRDWEHWRIGSMLPHRQRCLRITLERAVILAVLLKKLVALRNA